MLWYTKLEKKEEWLTSECIYLVSEHVGGTCGQVEGSVQEHFIHESTALACRCLHKIAWVANYTNHFVAGQRCLCVTNKAGLHIVKRSREFDERDISCFNGTTAEPFRGSRNESTGSELDVETVRVIDTLITTIANVGFDVGEASVSMFPLQLISTMFLV